MPQKIREVMTRHPVTLPEAASTSQAAHAMREWDIGDVLVVDPEGHLAGIVTDRDIVMRVLAVGRDPKATALEWVCSRDIVKVHPEDPVDAAIELMRRKAIRRLPVVANGRPIGMVSLGDLARNRAPRSVLGKISCAPPNE